jgi:hypothetical protein
LEDILADRAREGERERGREGGREGEKIKEARTFTQGQAHRNK